jgi:hypothetical protein
LDYVLSNHCSLRIVQRGIRELWVQQTLENPQKKEHGIKDPSVYINWKKIPESQGRILAVVYNPNLNPVVVITAYFDRGMRGEI